MGEVNVTELRGRLPEYLRRVQRGEELRITSRGKVIARIVPEMDERKRARAALEEGRLDPFFGVLRHLALGDRDAGRQTPVRGRVVDALQLRLQSSGTIDLP